MRAMKTIFKLERRPYTKPTGFHGPEAEGAALEALLMAGQIAESQA